MITTDNTSLLVREFESVHVQKVGSRCLPAPAAASISACVPQVRACMHAQTHSPTASADAAAPGGRVRGHAAPSATVSAPLASDAPVWHCVRVQAAAAKRAAEEQQQQAAGRKQRPKRRSNE